MATEAEQIITPNKKFCLPGDDKTPWSGDIQLLATVLKALDTLLPTLATVVPGVIYSAAGTPLPTPTSTLKGVRATVSDATLPTFLGAYVSGGAVLSPVLCTGSGWVTA